MARARRPIAAKAPASARRARPTAAAPRAWQRMLSGRRLDLIDPSAVDIEIEDIAHGLSRVARWNGQTVGEQPMSVAQHSLIVEDILVHQSPGVAARWRLAALLHDAAEYVIGDMISPFKAALGLDYQAFEDRLSSAIHIRFGLPAVVPADIKALIKSADRACAYFEATQLAGFTAAEALRFFGAPPERLHLVLEPLRPDQAKSRYLERFKVLIEAAGFTPVAAAFDTE